jgi:hypothetical protein
MDTGWMGEGGMKQHPPKANFQKLVNKIAIKAKIGDSVEIFPESLDPPDKNMSYPLPWIFNPVKQSRIVCS